MTRATHEKMRPAMARPILRMVSTSGCLSALGSGSPTLSAPSSPSAQPSSLSPSSASISSSVSSSTSTCSASPSSSTSSFATDEVFPSLTGDTMYYKPACGGIDFVIGQDTCSVAGIAQPEEDTGGCKLVPGDVSCGTTTKGRRRYVSRSCISCKIRHRKCDGKTPCSRCIAAGRADSCTPYIHRKRGPQRKTDQSSVSRTNITAGGASTKKPPKGPSPKSLEGKKSALDRRNTGTVGTPTAVKKAAKDDTSSICAAPRDTRWPRHQVPLPRSSHAVQTRSVKREHRPGRRASAPNLKTASASIPIDDLQEQQSSTSEHVPLLDMTLAEALWLDQPLPTSTLATSTSDIEPEILLGQSDPARPWAADVADYFFNHEGPSLVESHLNPESPSLAFGQQVYLTRDPPLQDGTTTKTGNVIQSAAAAPLGASQLSRSLTGDKVKMGNRAHPPPLTCAIDDLHHAHHARDHGLNLLQLIEQEYGRPVSKGSDSFMFLDEFHDMPWKSSDNNATVSSPLLHLGTFR